MKQVPYRYRWGDHLLGLVALVWLAEVTGHWRPMWLTIAAAFVLNVAGAATFVFRGEKS